MRAKFKVFPFIHAHSRWPKEDVCWCSSNNSKPKNIEKEVEIEKNKCGRRGFISTPCPDNPYQISSERYTASIIAKCSYSLFLLNKAPQTLHRMTVRAVGDRHVSFVYWTDLKIYSVNSFIIRLWWTIFSENLEISGWCFSTTLCLIFIKTERLKD